MTETLAVAPWRFFTVRVGRVRRLSPSFVRVTLTGADLDQLADNGFDQRIKLVFPIPGHAFTHLPTGPDWYAQWRALPEPLRNPFRTYTVRAVRPQSREVDVDMLLHPDGGPAAQWAEAARPDDEITMLGPDRGYPGEHGGLEFHPPAGAGLLLAGDETAVPAITVILERLPADARGEALLEVPVAADAQSLSGPAGVRVNWLPRDGAGYGSRLVPAVVDAARRLVPTGEPTSTLQDVDVDHDMLWEVPEEAPAAECYAWLAGEAGVIRTLRRHLVAERGMDRRSVAFMGYWRLGRADEE